MKPWLRAGLFAALSAVGACVATFAAYVVYATISDAATKPRRPRVAFSDFVAEVEAGRVGEIRVRGNVYVFDVAGTTATREAIGPAATRAELETLRPSDPSRPAPKLVVE
ncbi:MAG TPA: hypothetical protein VIF62_21425 [Labilithrix sp.]|jgi:hypothetical protein